MAADFLGATPAGPPIADARYPTDLHREKPAERIVGSGTLMKQSRPRVATRTSARVLSVESDERLVALFRAGDESAFEVLVRRHRRPLLAYCRRFLPDSGCEDVVQHAFLSVYRALPEMEGEVHFRAWLYRIVSNRAIDVLRPRPPLDADSDEHFDRIAAPDAYDSSERLAEVVAGAASTSVAAT